MSTQKIENNYSDDARLTILENSVKNINDTLIRFEKRFDQLDAKLERIDAKFDRIDAKFERINDAMKSDLRWTFTVFSGLILGLAGVMAHGFHWF